MLRLHLYLPGPQNGEDIECETSRNIDIDIRILAKETLVCFNISRSNEAKNMRFDHKGQILPPCTVGVTSIGDTSVEG